MLAYTIRRFLLAIPIFFGITALIWLISTTNPDGGPLQAYLGHGGGRSITNAQLDAIKHRLGLDQPLPVRYLVWVGNLFHGDLGNSIITKQNVLKSLTDRILPTLLLLGTAFILQELFAIPLGVYSAIRRGTAFDQIFTFITYMFFALPTFWLGLMGIVIFGVTLGWLPFQGIVDVRAIGTTFGTPAYTEYFKSHTFVALIDIGRHLALPVFILAAVGMAGDSRFLRAQMLEVLNQDYIRTARAKGLSTTKITWKHAARNALLPLITNIGLQIPTLLGGAIVTEQIFSWPGMGQLYVKAAQQYDYPLLIAYLVILAGLTLIFNILTDLSYALIDPRIRYS